MTRHAVICLREEARRLIEALGECAVDKDVELGQKIPLIRQMTVDLEDVRLALLELGGREALETVLTA